MSAALLSGLLTGDRVQDTEMFLQQHQDIQVRSMLAEALEGIIPS
jgi:hypothetical protein